MDKGKKHNIHLLVKRKSTYLKTAKRVRYAERIRKQKPTKPGELIQIDHMVLNLYNGLKIKEFRAVEPTTRLSISSIYNSANKFDEYADKIINTINQQIEKYNDFTEHSDTSDSRLH